MRVPDLAHMLTIIALIQFDDSFKFDNSIQFDDSIKSDGSDDVRRARASCVADSSN